MTTNHDPIDFRSEPLDFSGISLRCSHCGRALDPDADDYHDDHLEECEGTGPGCTCDLTSCPRCCTWCARERSGRVLDEIVILVALVLLVTWWTVLAVVHLAGR